MKAGIGLTLTTLVYMNSDNISNSFVIFLLDSIFQYDFVTSCFLMPPWWQRTRKIFQLISSQPFWLKPQSFFCHAASMLSNHFELIQDMELRFYYVIHIYGCSWCTGMFVERIDNQCSSPSHLLTFSFAVYLLIMMNPHH